MATKNCPKCSSQVPVATKKCSCGHSFFATRRGASTSTSSTHSNSGTTSSRQDARRQEMIPDTAVSPSSLIREEDLGELPRRTGRLQREKPRFYDALELETEMRKQKLLLRKQSKSQSSKSDESKISTSKTTSNNSVESDESATATAVAAAPQEEEIVETIKEEVEEQGEPKKRKRGRPPGLSTKKNRLSKPRVPITINNSSRILPNRKAADPVNTTTNNNGVNVNNNVVEEKVEVEDIMSDISPEKALQFNIVLNEINRKWVNASWKC